MCVYMTPSYFYLQVIYKLLVKLISDQLLPSFLRRREYKATLFFNYCIFRHKNRLLAQDEVHVFPNCWWNTLPDDPQTSDYMTGQARQAQRHWQLTASLLGVLEAEIFKRKSVYIVDLSWTGGKGVLLLFKMKNLWRCIVLYGLCSIISKIAQGWLLLLKGRE